MLAPIQGFDGYFVSDAGVVIGRKGKALKAHLTEKGYSRVTLTQGNTFRLHRIVADAFVVKPDGCNEVNHIDGDKRNNAATNLEWTTRRGNMQHANLLGLVKRLGKGEDGLRAILTQEQVDFIRKNCVKRDKELSMTALAKRFGVSVSCIHLAYHGKNWN